MSVLGRFIPYHFQCCFNLTETAPDRLMVGIPPAYDCHAMCQGFLSEQDSIFTNISSSFLDDPGTRIWVVAYTARVFHGCAAFLLPAYSEYRPCFVPKDNIAFARELGFSMEVELGFHSNVRDVLALFEVMIEATNF